MLYAVLALASMTIFNLSCQKENSPKQQQDEILSNAKKHNHATPPYDLNVVLRGVCNQSGDNENDDDKKFEDGEEDPSGYLKFRQDPDPAKIINLDIKVRHLAPNHEYLLQRAVDAINEVVMRHAWAIVRLT